MILSYDGFVLSVLVRNKRIGEIYHLLANSDQPYEIKLCNTLRLTTFVGMKQPILPGSSMGMVMTIRIKKESKDLAKGYFKIHSANYEDGGIILGGYGQIGRPKQDFVLFLAEEASSFLSLTPEKIQCCVDALSASEFKKS